MTVRASRQSFENGGVKRGSVSAANPNEQACFASPANICPVQLFTSPLRGEVWWEQEKP